MHIIKIVLKRFLQRTSSQTARQHESAPKLVANKLDRVLSLRSLGVPIDSIVDVGVQESTNELIQAIPDKHHHLFEPVELWHSRIAKNYAGLAHTLYPVALSDTNGSAWLVQTSLNSDSIATHASIEKEPKVPDGRHIVDCKEIEVRRLDCYSSHFTKDFLLKIDVDGKELDIIRGSSGCIRNASVVIVEADWSSLTMRGRAIEESGFQLIDIVDRVMYGESLWQCDLVYLRNDLMNNRLRPPMFNWQHWRPLP